MGLADLPSLALQTSSIKPMGPHQGSSQIVEGLYLHLPFCFHKCHYCDFYSVVGAGEVDQEQFTDALLSQIAHTAALWELRPRTIFVGGGTPTLLAGGCWGRLLTCLRRLGLLDQVVEFTVEANPETVDLDLIKLLREGGVNRVSIGAQSFQVPLLATLERHHQPASVARAVRTCREGRIENLNLDLIFAIPGQSVAGFENDLQQGLALEPQHLSCYGLTYEPGTAMTRRLAAGRFQAADEAVEADMYALAMDRLEQAGFEHYEISNWARPGLRCAANLIYWKNRNWVGCGPSAASHVAGVRWANEAHLGRYIAGCPDPPVVNRERLSADRRLGEQLMLGLRLREGVELQWLDEQLSDDLDRRLGIDELCEQGFLERTATHLRLTRSGLHVANAVIRRLL